ncbi:MAG: fibronectin type III domain-containing protein [Acidobacteria bacterium]|nr:fibronectin type III domain-containing protein [Acidobacteriota bacterium]
MNLIWKPPTTGGPPVSYVLEAGSASGLSNLAVLSISDGRTSFTASNVANGTYYVRVKAQNAAGTSPPSNEVTVIVNAVTCQGPPLSPSGLASSVNGTTVTLTWIGPSGPPSNSPSTYIVEIGSAPFLSDLSISDLEGIATTMTANNVGAGKYVIRVRAKNACGTSGTSNEVVVNVVGAQGILAGTWLGTDRATRSNGQSAKLDLTFVVQHSGQTLVGAAAAIGFRFRVTQTEASSTVLTFAGTWTWGNSGQCAGQLAPGSITVDTTTNTMTGSFAGVNPDCLTETHDFTVTKQ